MYDSRPFSPQTFSVQRCHFSLSCFTFLPLGNGILIQLTTFFTYYLRELIQNNSWLWLLWSSKRTKESKEIHLPFFLLTLCAVAGCCWDRRRPAYHFWIPEPCQVSCSSAAGSRAVCCQQSCTLLGQHRDRIHSSLSHSWDQQAKPH